MNKKHPAGAIFSRGQNSYSYADVARVKPLKGKLEGSRTTPLPLPPLLHNSGITPSQARQAVCYNLPQRQMCFKPATILTALDPRA